MACRRRRKGRSTGCPNSRSDYCFPGRSWDFRPSHLRLEEKAQPTFTEVPTIKRCDAEARRRLQVCQGRPATATVSWAERDWGNWGLQHAQQQKRSGFYSRIPYWKLQPKISERGEYKLFHVIPGNLLYEHCKIRKSSFDDSHGCLLFLNKTVCKCANLMDWLALKQALVVINARKEFCYNKATRTNSIH